MDEQIRKQQFDYRNTSSKVLPSERDPRQANEPTGEADSLRGRIGKMGDRYSQSKPPELLKKMYSKKVPVKASVQASSIPEGLLYYPKTAETRLIYESMLSMMQGYLGDQPNEMFRDAVDQILAVLKTENILDVDKKTEIELIIGNISNEDFNKMYMMSKQLTDYNPDINERGEMEEDIGVPIVFDEKAEEENNEEDEDMDEEEQLAINEILAEDIDSEWLKIEIGKYFDNIDEVLSKESQVLEYLAIEDLRKCENKLVMALGFNKLPLATLLLANRYKILMCTKFHKAKNEDERQVVIKEMQSSPEGLKILEKLLPKSQYTTILPKRVYDLSKLEFAEGSLTMSNTKVKLPPGSIKNQNPGYEEVIIPPPPVKPQSGIHHSQFPEYIKPAFSKVKELNSIQSAVFPKAYNSDENLLICAPTGAGKTNIALLCILNTLKQHIKNNGELDLNGFKIIYIAPMKALVSETCGNLSNRLSKYDVTVRELTGDAQLTKQQIHETQVIVTTPEKWDIVTRKSGERTFTDKVKLIIIDEVHLLHDMRGPVLEAIVARTLRLNATHAKSIRLVGLSATLPNYSDVANFLQVPESGLFFFDKSYRPVPLEQKYIGINEKKAIKKFLLMNEICYEKILQQAGKSQVLVFVHSRKETARTAKALRDLAVTKNDLFKFLKEDSKSKEVLSVMSQSIENNELKDLLPSSFAIHHAGLNKDDRKLVEDLFADKHIQVLVSTATLAWGVNLPAHTVIIKGTQVYSPEKGTWVEISPQDMLQMIGRAGRMDYDTTGEGIVITSHNRLQYYLSLLNQQLPIESQMMSQLSDHLNAEIVLGTISTMQDAINWFEHTYLYTRLMKSPSLYGYDIQNYTEINGYVVDILHSAATLLNKHNLIRYDKRTGVFQATALGQVASHYYIKPESVSIYNENLKSHMGPIDLLRIFALSYEFKYLPVREEEKQEVAKLMEKVPYPVKGAMDEPASKMNILLQAYISKLKLEGFTLMSDMVFISQSAGRIMRALFEIVVRRGWAQLTYITLNFCKMINHRMWSVMNPLRQFNRLSEDILRKLEKKEGLMWEHFYDLTASQIGELLKMPGKGNQVHSLVHMLPKLKLEPYIQPITRSCLRIELIITKDFQWEKEIHGTSQLFWIFVEDVDSEIILHYEQFMMKKKHSDSQHVVVFTVPLFEPLPPNYYIKVISDKWLQSEVTIPVAFRHLILPEKFSPCTELVSMPPVPIFALKWPEVEKEYEIEFLNSIQSQVFEAIYQTNESVFFGSSDNSGVLVAELAIFKALSEGVKKIIYTSQFSEIVQLAQSSMKKFENLGESVGILAGVMQKDLAILAKNRIIFAAAEHLDTLSRRWRQRKAFHDVGLLIVDQVQLVGETGSVLEVCISRMRYAASQLEINLRIVAIGCSIANAKDIAEWLGISYKNIFNFHTKTRPNPLNLVLQSFDHGHRQSRILAMSKPVYAAIKSYGSDESIIIFTPDRKVGRLMALDLITYTIGDENPYKFLSSKENIKEIEKIQSKILSQCLMHGIGLIYEGMKEFDRKLVESLYKQKTIKVLVISSSLCWEIGEVCKLSIIMDACRYDGKEHRYVDYTIPEILQMINRANTANATSVILCQTPRKEFLKKFISEPFPVESHLDQYLSDHYNAEIVAKTITSKQDAVDWITWTFLYRRLTKNPNYYNLEGVSGAHINDHLSELVENSMEELKNFNCVEIIEENELSPLNLGIIASHYYIKCSTIDIYSSSLTPNTKIRGILEILVSALELELLPVRQGEEKYLREINSLISEPLEKDYLNEPHTKALLLLFSHFSRFNITQDLIADQVYVVKKAIPLIHSIVDIAGSNGWLLPSIYAMMVCQMITQALWDKDSPLLQLPHFDAETVDRCRNFEVEDIADFTNMEDDQRNQLGFTQKQLEEIAGVCNDFPDIDISYEAPGDVMTGEEVEVEIQLERSKGGESVYAPYFPGEREEYWWVVIGEPKANRLFAIKKVKIQGNVNVKMNFVAPEPGNHDVMIYLLCDSYIGDDQNEKMHLTVYA
ncbi:unnamed protein product [Blepharisma stoltei]|uniref:Sec63-domain-containing protein n=1 Tax=Blepharisma stoltei TaxID=1481888 RepID=A0AAU9IWR3_9CILI|nr:unnamed protein product [Blepharisma stoltei]